MRISARKQTLSTLLWGGAYARGWVGFPTLLVATSWAAIWLLWPSMTPPRPNRVATETRIEHAPPHGGWVQAEPASVFIGPSERTRFMDDDVPALSVFQYRVDQPESLARAPVAMQWPDAYMARAFETVSFRQALPLSPPTRRTAFRAPTETDRPQIVYRVSPALEAAGFAVPESALNALNEIKAAGTVVLQVEVGESGMPDHVFVETGSGHHDLDRVAVRAVYQGRTQAGAPSFGRVFIGSAPR